ncbi:hypothetical protein JG688_00012985 [Phytophthora aleatoria]|uniref:Apple domain-containing protein n=1 Tax=Phytophthora aleatoria TaxID=2496075 RepID=A0A8J5IXV4_9STRA|nr:hypothetical protein JG688_00012985 [Phytophthora aleatoria]
MVSRGGPFQTLKLTDQERQQCHDRAFQLLDRTLRSYDERDGQAEDGRSSTPLHHSNLDNTRWKLLKTQAGASLYTERNSCTLQDYNLLGGDWEKPVVVLMAGTIRGDLDEIMFGIETPDSVSFRTRTELFTKQPVDCAVLSELMGPTEGDPFRFLGVTWMMYEYKWPLKAMIKPRDIVTLTATGTTTRANGDRIGYEVVQPARLPQCPPLPGGIIRGKVMYATIFKQQEPGIVDVYINTYVETQGLIIDKLIVTVTWKANFGYWIADKLTEMKKLQWCIANCRRSMIKRHSGEAQDENDSCALCASPTCYKCRVERTLKVFEENNGRLTDQFVVVCQPCLMFVQKLRPTDIARLHYKQRHLIDQKLCQFCICLDVAKCLAAILFFLVMKRSLLIGLTLGWFAVDGAVAGTGISSESEEVITAPVSTSTSTGLTCGAQLKSIYYHGFNLQTSTVSNAAACCDLCAAYSGCVLYTYFRSSSTGQSLCYLKNGAGENTNYADSSSVTAVSAFMVSATTAPTPTRTPTPTTATPSACNEQLKGVFYNDNTIFELSIDSADECCQYCSQLASEGCVLYTLYVSKCESVKRCLLKSAAGTTTNYTNSDDLTVVSAFLAASAMPSPSKCTVAEGQYCGNAQGTTCCESDSYCQPWNTDYYQCIGLPDGCSNLETDIDYYGNDLSSALTLYPWLCCSLCQETEGCNAYTFVNLDPAGPTCYMKTSTAGRVTNVESDSSTLEPSMGSKGIPFQELKLTVDEQQNCRDRSFQLLDRTLRSYDERDGQEDNGRPSDPLHHSNLDNTRWKQLKTQESASLYVERSNSMHRDDNILGGDWINPMVFLMAGTIQGELDEVMLGVETPIVASLRDRKEILAMQPVDCAVLSELAGPTESDPFQYIGIQWMAFKHGWPLKAVSSPRDFVTLASKGTMTRANGDRIGYQVVQPAKLPQCPPLPGSMRTNLMYAAIFKQQEPGIVDVFVLTYIETLSALLNKVVVSATWKSNMDLWSAPQLAEMKKMQWCLANCKAQRRQLQRQASPSAKNVCKRCLEIRKVRGSDIEDKTACVLCVSPTCSNCRVDRTLEAIDERKLKLIEHSVVVCRACMVFVQHMRPVDIVRQTLTP